MVTLTVVAVVLSGGDWCCDWTGLDARLGERRTGREGGSAGLHLTLSQPPATSPYTNIIIQTSLGLPHVSVTGY